MTRENINKYFMRIALEVAQRGTCERARVGSVLTKNNHIISTGYNGSPKGISHCLGKHIMVNGHCIKAVHAELNCILSAAKFGINVSDAVLYSTHRPCFRCMQALINMGIREVFYNKDYIDEYQKEFESELVIKQVNL